MNSCWTTRMHSSHFALMYPVLRHPMRNSAVTTQNIDGAWKKQQEFDAVRAAWLKTVQMQQQQPLQQQQDALQAQQRGMPSQVAMAQQMVYPDAGAALNPICSLRSSRSATGCSAFSTNVAYRSQCAYRNRCDLCWLAARRNAEISTARHQLITFIERTWLGLCAAAWQLAGHLDLNTPLPPELLLQPQLMHHIAGEYLGFHAARLKVNTRIQTGNTTSHWRVAGACVAVAADALQMVYTG